MAASTPKKAPLSEHGVISRPTYDRNALSPGILHIGVGNFHRAHQAIYMDRLFELGLDHDWAIVGSGIKAHDEAVRSDLEKQDWLTTVVELDPNGLTARSCGSMIDYAAVGPAGLMEWLARPEIRIVSLTVTEGGYYTDATTGGFNAQHPDILGDVENPDDPQTVFGCLIAALSVRRQAGLEPFTIMSCDNLPENGQVTRNTVCGLAQAMSPELGVWIESHVAFPNGMVDCITPATSDRERQLVKNSFGIVDARPVVCEPFRQWVLEDNFPAGRPKLEEVGVEFVDDVAPHELMKLRILNGGHAAIAYPAGLLGIHFVHDAMDHPLISGFLRKLVTSEVIPTVPAIRGVDFDDYFDSVVSRFSNPVVGDTIPRLCLDGSNRQPKFILPTIEARLEQGASIDGLALEVALWCRYCAGVDEQRNSIELDDENAAMLREHAERTKVQPEAFLAMDSIFGVLGENEEFRSAFSSAIQALWSDGTHAVLQNYLEYES